MRPDVPPLPANELTRSTAGSAMTIFATASCLASSVGKAASGATSIPMNMLPVSSVGKKPFGIAPKPHTAIPIEASVTRITMRLRASVQSSARA